jgi:hypothetical protein
MSKIALESNPSGTGTFTIKSPNSNVDRELTLPDSAGEIYNRGNILGTVSQSSGVPTGAIIERGSNANGEFVRYADGTLICFHNLSIDLGTSFTDLPLAASFTGRVHGSGWAVEFSTFGTILAAYADMHMSDFGTGSIRIVKPTLAVGFSRNFQYTAIGRWF